MEKQEKVLKKIKSVGNRRRSLNLGHKNNDECYTQELMVSLVSMV